MAREYFSSNNRNAKFTSGVPHVPRVPRVAYKLQIAGAPNSTHTVIRTVSQRACAIMDAALPKAGATFEGGGSTHSTPLVVTGVAARGYPGIVSDGS